MLEESYYRRFVTCPGSGYLGVFLGSSGRLGWFGDLMCEPGSPERSCLGASLIVLVRTVGGCSGRHRIVHVSARDGRV